MSIQEVQQTLVFTCDWSDRQVSRLPLSGPPPSWFTITGNDTAGISRHMSDSEAQRRLSYPLQEVTVVPT